MLSLKAWLPILQFLAPATLVEASKSIDFTREIVNEFLATYMFKNKDDEKAYAISKHLSDHKNFNSHGKKLDSDYMKNLGLNIIDLEKDQKFQDLVLSIFHSTELCFLGSAAVKIISNNADRFYIENHFTQYTNIQRQQIIRPMPKQKPK